MKTASEIVKLARSQSRPTTLDFIAMLFEDFVELKGDRYFGDDQAIVGGVAVFDNTPVTVIGMQKGTDLTSNMQRNFGSPHPEGYRKAARLMKQAEKFQRPIVTLVNTAGAYCSSDSESRGIGEAIAQNLMLMSQLTVPIICFLIGEGGSGGALALAVGNKVYMLEHSMYSILSPEGFASILWKDSTRAAEAAEMMKITPPELHARNIVDGIVRESKQHSKRRVRSNERIAEDMAQLLRDDLAYFATLSPEAIKQHRQKRFAQF